MTGVSLYYKKTQLEMKSIICDGPYFSLEVLLDKTAPEWLSDKIEFYREWADETVWKHVILRDLKERNYSGYFSDYYRLGDDLAYKYFIDLNIEATDVYAYVDISLVHCGGDINDDAEDEVDECVQIWRGKNLEELIAFFESLPVKDNLT